MVNGINLVLDFLNNNLGFVTLIAGVIVYLVYLKQKQDNKKNAARIILQEIRRAEDIISDYKENRQYKFTKKIIATNSWAKNIHYFVGDLSVDELDKISNLYSTGEYLDSIITKVSDFNFEENLNIFKDNVKKIAMQFQAMQQNVQSSGPNIQSGQQIIQGPAPNEIAVTMPAPWKKLLDEITDKHEPIYHSTICEKLKKIAKLK